MTRRTLMIARPTGIAMSIALALFAACGSQAPVPQTLEPRASGAGADERAVDPEPAAFQPTVANAATPPGDGPAGMVWIPGGEFSMGAADPPGMDDVGMSATTDSRPIHRVYVDGFWMDRTEVTNDQFRRFVDATGYVTVAERVPSAKDFPDAPPENLVAGSVVFAPPAHPVPLTDHLQWWAFKTGANWRHPEGPGSILAGRERFPVVQIGYDDAVAFATWAGKRLPTEAEWEFAARGGLSGNVYAWGDQFMPEGHAMANTHQGHFPNEDDGEDGMTGLGPVAQFPPNGYGLHDVAGNVWEWVSDWYRPDYYSSLANAGGVARNPQGPDTPFDPSEPTERKRVHRGGSFLCTDQDLLTLHGGHQGSRRRQHRHESSGRPFGEGSELGRDAMENRMSTANKGRGLVRAMVGVVAVLAAGCGGPVPAPAPQSAQTDLGPAGAVLPFPPTPSASVAGLTMAESTYKKRVEPKHLADGAPNILVILMDDVGPATPSTYGGEINTPTLDRVSKMGVSFNRFHSTAMCSPTRAALLTGRNHTRVGNGQISAIANDFDGFSGIIPKSSATVAEVLKNYGYNTGAWGKWHNTPEEQITSKGPFEYWPTGYGFEYLYGFLAGEASQYEPTLTRNTTQVTEHLPKGYHLTDDIASDAIKWLREQKAYCSGQAVLHVLGAGRLAWPAPDHEGMGRQVQGQVRRGLGQVSRARIRARQGQGLDPAERAAHATPGVHGGLGLGPRGRATVPASPDGGVCRVH